MKKAKGMRIEMAKLLARGHETALLVNEGKYPTTVITNQTKVIDHMTKHFGPGTPFNGGRGSNSYYLWLIPKDCVSLPRPTFRMKAEAAAAAARARRAEEGKS